MSLKYMKLLRMMSTPSLLRKQKSVLVYLLLLQMNFKKIMWPKIFQTLSKRDVEMENHVFSLMIWVCLYHHVIAQLGASQKMTIAQAAALLRFFPTSSGGHVLLLDDNNLHFSSSLARHFDSSKIISTTCLSESTLFDSSLENVKILWGLHHP